MNSKNGSQEKLRPCCRFYLLAAFLIGLPSVSSWAQQGLSPDDFAQIYVDQYFEPPPGMELSMSGENKAEALAHFTVGRMQENKGRNKEAITSYLKVLDLQPDQLSLARKCAYLLARSGKQDEANALLEKTLSQNPDTAYPYVMLSEFLSTYHGNIQENKERSLELAREAVDKFPTDALTYEHLAKMYLRGKRPADARDLLLGALEKKNSDPNFWLRLGVVAIRVWPLRIGVEGNEKELAILNRFYTKATDNAGSNYKVSERAGDFYLATKQYDQAESIFKQIISGQTDRLDLRRKLARVYLEKEDYPAYVDTLSDIVEINPEDLKAHRDLANAYGRMGDAVNSIKHQRIALKIGKGSAADYMRLAMQMIQSELHEEAVDFIKEAAYLFPDNPEFLYRITGPLGALNRRKEATEYFEACEKLAKEQQPDLLNEYFYFNYGANVERDGDIDLAAKLFKKSIELMGKRVPQPNNKEAKRFTALVYNYIGYMWVENDMNIKEAGEFIKEAVKLDPESGAIADSLGWYYFKVGDYPKALEALKKSEELIEQSEDEEVDPVILDHIGRTYYALGNRDEAIKYLTRAVAKAKPDDPHRKEYEDRLTQYRAGTSPPPADSPAGE